MGRCGAGCRTYPNFLLLGRKSGDNFTAAEKRSIWERESGVCQWCHERMADTAEAEFHHIMPVAKGGDPHDWQGNGMLLHAKCHTQHYESLHPYEDMAYVRGMYSRKARLYYRYRRKE